MPPLEVETVLDTMKEELHFKLISGCFFLETVNINCVSYFKVMLYSCLHLL